MRPIIIGIGGAYSGAGKTTIACEVLKKLKKWGAIKYTKTSLYCSIIDDINVISEEGKDTRRLLDSGAEKVLWVQSPVSELPESLSVAVEMLSYLKGIVVEGNTAIEILKPDLVIFVSGVEKKIKKGADRILAIADVVIFQKKAPARIPEGAKRFQLDEVEKWLNLVIGHINESEDNRQFR